MMNYGRIEIKLDKYLKDNNISRSSLSRNGELRYTCYFIISSFLFSLPC